MDRGAWWATVHGVTQSQTQLSDQAQHSGTIAKNPPANAGSPDPCRDDPECTGATSPYAEAPEPVLYN